MKTRKNKTWIWVVPALALAGCTTVKIEQTDESNPEKQTRVVRTQVSGRTFIAGYQTLQNLKTMQTDRSQGTGIQALNQAAPTNTLELLIELLRLVK